MKKVIIDTGFIVALFNTKDQWHSHAKQVAHEIAYFQWNTTSFVIQEVFWLLSKRKGFSAALLFFQKAKSLLTLPSLPRDWMDRMAKILQQYSSARIDLTDASLVVLADHLKTGQIASVDRKDFSFLRWNSGKGFFYNLMDI